MLDGNNVDVPLPITPDPSMPLLLLDFGNTLQNLRVSSPAPVTIDDPSGDIARYNTLKVCPVSVVIFSIDGYFQTMTWFKEYPCVLTSSSLVLENIRLHTYDPVFIQFIGCRVRVFQNLIH
jgi:hypothetical protein